MNVSLRLQDKLYPYSAYLPNRFIRFYFRNVAEASPSLQALGPDANSKVAEFDIAYNAAIRRNILNTVLCDALIAFAFLVTASGRPDEAVIIISLISGAILIAVTYGLRWSMNRSTAEYAAVTQLFLTVAFLEENAAEWSRLVLGGRLRSNWNGSLVKLSKFPRLRGRCRQA